MITCATDACWPVRCSHNEAHCRCICAAPLCCRTEAREELRNQVGNLRFDLNTVIETSSKSKADKKDAQFKKKEFLAKVGWSAMSDMSETSRGAWRPGSRQFSGEGRRCEFAVASKQPGAAGGRCWLLSYNLLVVCVAHALALRSVSEAITCSYSTKEPSRCQLQ